MAQQQNAVLTHCSLGVGAANSGALYVGSTTSGIHVNYPAGTTASFISLSSKDFQGGGTIFVRQNNIETAYPNGGGNNTRTQIGSFSLPVTPMSLSAGTVIPVPDTSAGTGTGQTSNVNITSAADGLDWVGGFSNVGAVVGMEIVLTNIAGGNTINIGNNTVGGGPGSPYPWVKWGFRESIRVRYVSTNFWAMVAHYGAYNSSDGCSSNGGRLIFTTNATPIVLYPFNQGTGGVSFICDVAVEITGGGGATYSWKGVSAAWDSANVNYRPLSWESEGGNAAGIALGANLTIADAGGAHNLMATGKLATNLRWTVNNLTMVQSP
jgi:hypothetical protein